MARRLGRPRWSYLLTREARHLLDEQDLGKFLAANEAKYGNLLRACLEARAKVWDDEDIGGIAQEDTFFLLAESIAVDDAFARQVGRVAPRGSRAWDAYLNWYTWLVLKELWAKRFNFGG
jgi:hypothetical protein